MERAWAFGRYQRADLSWECRARAGALTAPLRSRFGNGITEPRASASGGRYAAGTGAQPERYTFERFGSRYKKNDEQDQRRNHWNGLVRRHTSGSLCREPL